VAACPSGYFPMSGGGVCGGNAMWLQVSVPTTVSAGVYGWYISCSWQAEQSTMAWAMCCKLN
jgi:hypothetical protein